MAGFNGSQNVLAQCVPALARASQLLCTVTQPGQARDALQQAVGLLDGNGRFAEIPAVKELAERCRVTAQTGAEGRLVAACRQLGVTLARQMTALTQEIQQQAKAPARPAVPAAPAAPVAKEAPKPVAEVTKPVEAPRPVEKVALVEKAKPVEPVTPIVPPKPVEAAKPAEKAVPIEKPKPVEKPKPAEPAEPTLPVRPAAVEKPRPVEKPAAAPAPRAPEKGRPVEKAKPAPKPQVTPGLVERITVARTAAEKSAVTPALREGKRFAVVGNGTIIDTKANRMWAARLGPATSFRGAQSHAQKLRLANYADWRLPTPEELQQLVAEGGGNAVHALGMFTPERGDSVDWLWTSRSRRRFWIFGREATCLSLRTGQLGPQKAGASRVAALAVRSTG